MRRLLLILSLLLGACGQPSLPPAPATAGLAAATATLPVPATTEATLPSTVDAGPGRLYVTGAVLFSDPPIQRLSAYDPLSGEHFFSVDLPDNGTLYPAPDGVGLYFMNQQIGQQRLSALDARDGHTLWTWTDEYPLKEGFTTYAIFSADLQHLYLSRALHMQMEIVRTDLLELDLATRETRLVRELPSCHLGIIAAPVYVCAKNTFIATEPDSGKGTIAVMDLATGAMQAYDFNYRITSMDLRPGTSELWVQEAEISEGGVVREPLPPDITVLDLVTGARHELALPPREHPLSISSSALFFAPDGASATIFRDGSALQFATPAWTLQTTLPLSSTLFAGQRILQDGSGFVSVDARMNTLHPWLMNGRVLAPWRLADMRLESAVLAPVPPGPPLAPSPPPAVLAPETIGSGRFPPPPALGTDTLQAIADWLSADPAHLNALDALMDEWMLLYGGTPRRAAILAGMAYHTTLTGDVDSDGQDEVVIAWVPPTHWLEPVSGGSEIVFGVLDWDGTRYQVLDHAVNFAFDIPYVYFVPGLVQLADLTGDGRNEILVNMGACGASTCFSSPNIVQLQPDGLHNLLVTEAYTPADDLEPNVETSNSQFALVDLEGDGVLELQQTAGGSGSAGGCCVPQATATYAWNGVDFRLTRVEYADDPTDAYLQLIEATRLFRDERYAEAYERYQQALTLAANPATQMPRQHFSVREVARFQLMVTALLLERTDDAMQWRDAQEQPAQQAWAAQFWADYAATDDVATACASILADPFSHGSIAQTGYDDAPMLPFVCRLH